MICYIISLVVEFDNNLSPSSRGLDWSRQHRSEIVFDSYHWGNPNNTGQLKDAFDNPKYKQKSILYTFILYPDNQLHMWLLKYLECSGRYDFMYILHSPDDDCIAYDDVAYVQNESSYKQHYHVCIRFDYSKYWHVVVRDLYKWGLRYCEPVSDIISLTYYFVHHTSDAILNNKPFYHWEEMTYTGWFIDIVSKCKLREDTKNIASPLLLLLEYLDVCENRRDFYKFACSNPDLDKAFKTHQMMFITELQEKFPYGKKNYN